MIVERRDEWLCKQLFNLGRVEGSLVLSGALERMQRGIRWIPLHFLQLRIRLLLILFRIAADRLYFHHFYFYLYTKELF